MRSAMPRKVKSPPGARKSRVPRISRCCCAMPSRALALLIDEPARRVAKARPPQGQRWLAGMASSANTSSAMAINCATASSGSAPGKRCMNNSRARCRAVPRSSGPIGVIQRIERPQFQHMPGIDGIRIAQPGFDFGDGKAARPRRHRRRGRGRRHARRRRDLAEARAHAQHSDAAGNLQPQAARSIASGAAASARRWWARRPLSRRGSAAHRRRPPAWRNHAPPGRCARSGCSRPSVSRIGRENQGSAGAACGQVPSFNPPRMVRSKLCSRASSGPRMAMARMAAEARPHRHLHRQRRAARPDRSAARTAADPPAPVAELLRSECAAASPSAPRQSGQSWPSAQASRSAAARCDGDQIGQRRLVFARKTASSGARIAAMLAHQRMRQLRHARASRCARDRLAMPASPGSGRGPRKAAVQRARLGAERRRIFAQAGEGMLQQRQQRHRRESASAASASRQRNAPALVWAGAGRRNRRSRCPSASVRPPPAAPDCGPASPARRCGLRCLQGLAQRQRDHQRFLRRIVGGDQATGRPGPRRYRRRRLPPGRARHRWWARGAGFRAAAIRAPDCAARRRASPAPRRAPRRCRPAIASGRIGDGRDQARSQLFSSRSRSSPGRITAPLRQMGDRAQKSRGGGDRAGRTGRDHHAGGGCSSSRSRQQRQRAGCAAPPD